ncbi:MAG: hypothetical protein V1743_00210 [Nanoarchaeota archaeon]
MDDAEYRRLKAVFLKSLSNVPMPLRSQTIAIVDGKPVSWDAAFGEVKNDTPNAKGILRHLKMIGVLE